MRKVIYALAASLDNYVARPDGAVDWLFMQGEHMDDFAKSFASFDAVLMGRKTYEFALGHGMSAYPNLENYVFSHTMQDSPDKRVKIISDNAGNFVRDLKVAKGKNIWLCGGGVLAASLLAEDLIDEIIINVHPVLLGAGVPLLSDIKKQIDLEMYESKVYKNGLALLSYRVKV